MPIAEKLWFVHEKSDQERGVKIAHMQALITEGIESGSGERTMEELREAARKRAAGR
jgi:antitoxin ParD1/3/4